MSGKRKSMDRRTLMGAGLTDDVVVTEHLTTVTTSQILGYLVPKTKMSTT